MRERVAVFGGALDAGPTDDGGFRVHARLPLPTDWAAWQLSSWPRRRSLAARPAHRPRARRALTGRARPVELRDRRALVLSLSTVKTHVNRIFAKLHLENRVQAVVRAYECASRSPARH